MGKTKKDSRDRWDDGDEWGEDRRRSFNKFAGDYRDTKRDMISNNRRRKMAEKNSFFDARD